jgi:hypothetical protein
MKPVLQMTLCAMLALVSHRANANERSTPATPATQIVEAHERCIAILHAGDMPRDVGRAIPDEDGACEGGFAFAAGPDSVAFYDLPSATLKILSVSDGGSRSVAGIREGPWAGVRAANGTYFLLVDRMQEVDRPDRFALYALGANDPSWSRVLTFEVPGMRPNEFDASIRLVASSGSGIDLARSSENGLALVSPDGVVLARPQARRDIRLETIPLIPPIEGYRTKTGKFLGAIPRTIVDVIGRDHAGYRYSEGWLGDLRAVIDRFDTQGRLVASLRFKPLQGPTILRGSSFVIQPDGTIVRVQRTMDALIVSRASF